MRRGRLRAAFALRRTWCMRLVIRSFPREARRTSSMRPLTLARQGDPPSSRLWAPRRAEEISAWGTKAILRRNWRGFSIMRCPRSGLPLRGQLRQRPEHVDLPASSAPSAGISLLRASSVNSFRMVTLGEYPATTLSNSMMDSATTASWIRISVTDFSGVLSCLLSFLSKLRALGGSPALRKERLRRAPCLRPCRSRADSFMMNPCVLDDTSCDLRI